MKLLALSDIHGDTRWAKQQAEKAEKEKVDLVLLCGDLFEDDFNTEGIIGAFKEKNLKIAIMPGNHESDSTTYILSQIYNVIHLHGRSFQIGNIGFFGSGGTPVGPQYTEEETIFANIDQSHKYLGPVKKKILVTHAHPAQGLVDRLSFPGSTAIKKAIIKFKPDLHLCGHIHECEGMEDELNGVKSINVGKQGKIIEV